MLIDAVIYYLTNYSPPESARRFFNQHKVLSECVLKEIKLAEEQLSFSNNIFSINYFVEVSVDRLESPWNSLENFRNLMSRSTPCKAKLKYLEIVRLLCSHESLLNMNGNMLLIINKVVTKILISKNMISEIGRRRFIDQFAGAYQYDIAALETAILGKRKLPEEFPGPFLRNPENRIDFHQLPKYSYPMPYFDVEIPTLHSLPFLPGFQNTFMQHVPRNSSKDLVNDAGRDSISQESKTRRIDNGLAPEPEWSEVDSNNGLRSTSSSTDNLPKLSTILRPEDLPKESKSSSSTLPTPATEKSDREMYYSFPNDCNYFFNAPRY